MKIPEMPLRINSAVCSFSTPAVTTRKLAGKSLLSRQTHELSTIAMTKVEVEQHDINMCFL
jgi:hypothetical protein